MAGVREGAMMLGLSLLAVPHDIALTISFQYAIGGVLSSLPCSVSWYRVCDMPQDQDATRQA
jgi:hypothetical protein